MFDELSDVNFLMKCLHGETPNQNEAFNGTKWNRIPISRFAGYKQFEMGVLDAAVHFDIDNRATLLIYDKNEYEMNDSLKENTGRIKNANRKDTGSVKIRGRN